MSIGAELAGARRQAGLTIAQVSERTRIRPAIIEAIERDDFSVCGADFYARGHIRAIARVAGLDPEPLVQEYDAARDAATQENIPVSGGSRRSGTVPGTARPTPGTAPTAATAGPGTLPAGGGPWMLAAGGGPGALPPPRPPRRAPLSIALLVLLAAAVGVIIYQVASSHNAAPAGAPGKPAAAGNPSVTPRAGASPAAKPATPSASPTSASNQVVISLTAVTEPCWAQLTTSSGTTVYQGIVAVGTSMTWTEAQPVTLALGNPGAVRLTVDGQVRSGLGTNPVTVNLAPGQPPAG